MIAASNKSPNTSSACSSPLPLARLGLLLLSPIVLSAVSYTHLTLPTIYSV